MKRLFLIFFSLLSTFFLTWTVKANTPINRPSNLEEEGRLAWYEQASVAPIQSGEWTLDPTIPSNYIPVPGKEEIYMVVDDNGNIISYRQRIQQEDGSWVWKDVNPDIPEGYEPVEGLADVFKVTNPDGTVSYVKYIRNEDDTYCFIPVDENGIPLDIGTSANEIGKGYHHETGNIYSVYSDDGVLIGYRERVENDDGSYTWKEAKDPNADVGSTGSITPGTTYTPSSGLQLPSGTIGQGSTSGGYSSGQSLPGVEDSSNEQQIQMPDTSNYQYVTDGESWAYGEINIHNPDEGSDYAEENPDGTYTKTKVSRMTQTIDGQEVIQETIIYETYDQDGNLIMTRQEGPYAVTN